uniref:RNase H type-1 domain-containing protein n=1 Tax=Fagus sylvatica TaxID=28930 RepID=A0A2N9IUL5_FAGSY
MGEWVEDRDQLMALIQKGYSDLFTTSHTSSCRLSVPPCAPSLSDLEAQNLDNPLSSEEIKSSLWSLKPFKAPGPDGLHPGFFQRCWHICVGPESLSQFRPISLCNTVYKIVTKSIVARIRPLLSNLISPFQAAFVPGRRGIDNVIIAQELIHSLHKKKGAKGSFVVKIDLEKAYDRLEWSFIRETFCSHSGQKVNLSKSKVLFSPNVAPDVVARLIWDLGGSLVLRILGPRPSLLVGSLSSLSPAGRVVLIQSVTSSLPAYYMQNTALPSSICNELDRLNRNFLWGSTNERKKMHLESWWARTLTAKYCPNGITSSPLPINRGGSSNWRGLKLGHEDCIVCDTVDGSFSLRKAYQLAWGIGLEGFSRSIGLASCVQAELRALLDGLLMTVELNIPFLEIEMDSLLAVDLILATQPANAFLRSIVSDCRCLLQKFEGVSIKHIYREANMCADLLAKAGCDQLEDFVLFCTPPAHVLEVLHFDLSVDTRTRVIRI